MSPRSSNRHTSLVFLCILIISAGLFYSQSQRLFDWLKLRNYQPSPEIMAIVDQTTMTSKARHLFYINQPVLEDKAAFRDNCPEYEATIVLGCYRHGQGGIHVLRVSEERLKGVEQVTSAHEMLHAGYERLSADERSKVDRWLQEYADQGLQDNRIIETIKSYDKTEPGERSNEMHSIFGTEVADLPEHLESYYARYFDNRVAVTNYAAQYQQAFTSRQDQIDAYDARLNEQSALIKTNTRSLAESFAALSALEQDLQDLQQNDDVGNYNIGVPVYNQKVADYNQLLDATKSLIEEYNNLVVERNAIAAQTVELRQAIDSSALPASQ